MIIGISGTQGCGKSTVITDLQSKGFKVDVFSTARAVQEELGYSSLAQVLQQPFERVRKFQERILEVKHKRDLESACLFKGNSVVFVERTFADVYAYAKVWAERSPQDERKKFTEWAYYDFYEQCKIAQADVGYVTIILSPLATFEHDRRRADEASRFNVDMIINDFVRNPGDGGLARYLTYWPITETDRNKRLLKIEEFINERI